MRVQVALCLMALLALSSAARTGIQAKLIHDGMGAQMKGRSLDKALTLMTQIHADLKGPSNGAEALLQALTALKDSISENQANEIASFTEDEDHHRAEVSRIEGEISKGEQLIIALRDEVESYTEQEEIINSNLQSQDARLVEAKVQRDSTLAVIAKLDEDYENTKNDFGQCLQILDQAIEKINEAKGWTGTMLIQKNRSVFKQFSVLLESTLSKRFDSIYFHPILNIFSQLTSMNQDDVDLNTVVQASNAINNLKGFLLDGLNLETANYENTLQEYNDVLTLIKREIADLSLITIPNTQTTLDQIRETLAGKKEELDTTEKTLNFMKGALEGEELTWVNRVQQNELLLPEYESEYNSVCQAEAVIKLRVGELAGF